jgi:TonB-dependent Receptor Plug Domain
VALTKPKLDTTETNLGVSFSSKQIEALPLVEFRNPDQILELAPGVTLAPQAFGTYGPTLAPGIGTPGPFSVNGMRSRENDFLMDGSDLNDEQYGVRRQGFTAPFPQSIESLDVLQMITAGADTRFGRDLGGQINALSKAGGPKIHGTIYGFGTGHDLQAKNFFTQNTLGYSGDYQKQIPITSDGALSSQGVQFQLDPGYGGPVTVNPAGYGFVPNPLAKAPEDTRLQGGFAFGGQLARHTFYFVSLERQVEHQTVQSNFSVLTVAERGVYNSGATGLYPANAQNPQATGIDYINNLSLLPDSLPGDAACLLAPDSRGAVAQK